MDHLQLSTACCILFNMKSLHDAALPVLVKITTVIVGVITPTAECEEAIFKYQVLEDTDIAIKQQKPLM
jgi:hypothetical protein